MISKVLVALFAAATTAKHSTATRSTQDISFTDGHSSDNNAIVKRNKQKKPTKMARKSKKHSVTSDNTHSSANNTAAPVSLVMKTSSVSSDNTHSSGNNTAAPVSLVMRTSSVTSDNTHSSGN